MKPIDVSQMSQLLAEMRAMAAAAQGRPGAAAAPGGSEFATLVKGAIERVNGAQQQAQALAHAFELGDSKVRLSDVMVSMQKASIAFQAMTQVRNKLVAAYQEIMNMPV